MASSFLYLVTGFNPLLQKTVMDVGLNLHTASMLFESEPANRDFASVRHHLMNVLDMPAFQIKSKVNR